MMTMLCGLPKIDNFKRVPGPSVHSWLCMISVQSHPPLPGGCYCWFQSYCHCGIILFLVFYPTWGDGQWNGLIGYCEVVGSKMPPKSPRQPWFDRFLGEDVFAMWMAKLTIQTFFGWRGSDHPRLAIPKKGLLANLRLGLKVSSKSCYNTYVYDTHTYIYTNYIICLLYIDTYTYIFTNIYYFLLYIYIYIYSCSPLPWNGAIWGYGASISACEKGSQWAMALELLELGEMVLDEAWKPMWFEGILPRVNCGWVPNLWINNGWFPCISLQQWWSSRSCLRARGGRFTENCMCLP